MKKLIIALSFLCLLTACVKKYAVNIELDIIYTDGSKSKSTIKTTCYDCYHYDASLINSCVQFDGVNVVCGVRSFKKIKHSAKEL